MHTIFRFILLLTALMATAAAWPQESAEIQLDPAELSEERRAIFEKLSEEIAFEQRQIQRLAARIKDSDGVTETVLIARRDQTQNRMFKAILKLAREVAAERDNAVDVREEVETLMVLLERLPQRAFEAVQNIRAGLVFPDNETPPSEFVVQDQELSQDVENLDDIYKVIIDYIEIAQQFEIEVADVSTELNRQLTDNAANRSVFLELATEEYAQMRHANNILPDNSELNERLLAIQARVDLAASILQENVTLMNTLDLDTHHYRQQVLAATGEITTDVLDVSFVSGLMSEWSNAIVGHVKGEGPTLVFRFVLALLVLLAFMQLGKLAERLARRGLSPERVNLSQLLREMILTTVKNLVIILGALIALSQLGISLGPLLAGLGIAGFIIGFALQDSLSNFASGMMILIYRPFDVGDFVDVEGVQGTVDNMSLVNTTFLTIDNRKLVMPNNMIWKSVITNYTDQKTRRIDLVFGIAYSDDINQAESVINETLKKFDAILDEPKPIVRVHDLGDSSVNLIVRPWVQTTDYWETYWGLTKEIKLAFDKAGITIPFPQRDMHIFNEETA